MRPLARRSFIVAARLVDIVITNSSDICDKWLQCHVSIVLFKSRSRCGRPRQKRLKFFLDETGSMPTQPTDKWHSTETALLKTYKTLLLRLFTALFAAEWFSAAAVY